MKTFICKDCKKKISLKAIAKERQKDGSYKLLYEGDTHRCEPMLGNGIKIVLPI
jgi:uncharacterized protein YlaI